MLHCKYSRLWKCNAHFAQGNKWLVISQTYVGFLVSRPPCFPSPLHLQIVIQADRSHFYMNCFSTLEIFISQPLDRIFLSSLSFQIPVTLQLTAMLLWEHSRHQRCSDASYSVLLESYSLSSFHHRSPNLQFDGVQRAERSKHPTLLIETVGTEWKCSAQECFVSQIEKCLKFPAALVFLGGMHYYRVSGKTTQGNNRCLFGHKY